MQGVLGLGSFLHSSSCWLHGRMHTQCVHPECTELSVGVGLAHCIAAWEVCFVLKPLRTRWHQQAQAGWVVVCLCYSKRRGWEQDWHVSQSPPWLQCQMGHWLNTDSEWWDSKTRTGFAFWGDSFWMYSGIHRKNPVPKLFAASCACDNPKEKPS